MSLQNVLNRTDLYIVGRDEVGAILDAGGNPDLIVCHQYSIGQKGLGILCINNGWWPELHRVIGASTSEMRLTDVLEYITDPKNKIPDAVIREFVAPLLDAGAAPDACIEWLLTGSMDETEIRAILARAKYHPGYGVGERVTRKLVQQDAVARMRYLIELGARVDIIRPHWAPPLFHAKSAEMVNLLVDSGAGPDYRVRGIQHINGKVVETALEAALANGARDAVIEALIECGAKPKDLVRHWVGDRERWNNIVDFTRFVWRPLRHHCAPRSVKHKVHTMMVLRSARNTVLDHMPPEIMFLIFEFIEPSVTD